MAKFTRAKLLAVTVLKVTSLCLSLCLLSSSNAWAQPVSTSQIAPLIRQLTDSDFRVRHDAADHPRVLDAWVTKHLESVREEFPEKDTVRDRQVYIPVPVVLEGEVVPQLTGSILSSKFKKKRVCLLIWGEGGAGKTSLACQIARWAFAEDETDRLCEHPLLPVLIEEEFDCGEIAFVPVLFSKMPKRSLGNV